MNAKYAFPVKGEKTDWVSNAHQLTSENLKILDLFRFLERKGQLERQYVGTRYIFRHKVLLHIHIVNGQHASLTLSPIKSPIEWQPTAARYSPQFEGRIIPMDRYTMMRT